MSNAQAEVEYNSQAARTSRRVAARFRVGGLLPVGPGYRPCVAAQGPGPAGAVGLTPTYPNIAGCLTTRNPRPVYIAGKSHPMPQPPDLFGTLQSAHAAICDALERLQVDGDATLSRCPCGQWHLLTALPIPKHLVLEEALSAIGIEFELEPVRVSHTHSEVWHQWHHLPSLPELGLSFEACEQLSVHPSKPQQR